MIVIDANILCYYLDQSTKEHRYVKPMVDEIIGAGEKILTNTIIWMEVSHYLYKVSDMPREELKNKIKKLMRLSTMAIEPFDLSDLDASIDELSTSWQKPIGGRDTTIVAMMKKNHTTRILTHDKAFKTLGLEVIDPIPKGS
ncbi:MAG: type II toxin-antitoxin system VapC family toxin [Methanocellales archaeon]|nr:type II toxin-antitoxin system VapC family toxin [Methanocellales archaeon]